MKIDMCLHNMIQSPFIKSMRESFRASISMVCLTKFTSNLEKQIHLFILLIQCF